MLKLEKLTDKKSAIRMGPFGSSLKKEELTKNGIMTLWIENIVHNKFSWDYKQYITKEKFEELRGFKVQPEDVIMTMMGTVGKVAIVPNDIGTAIITSHLLKITLDQKKCLPQFLYYFLQSNFIYRQILSQSRGVVMSGLNTKIVKSLLIKVPSINEQEKIASILSNIDELIQKQEEKITLTQKLMKGRIQTLLTRGIGHKYPQEFKKEDWLFRKKIEIPQEWEWEQLLDTSSLKGRIGWQGLTSSEYRKEGKFHLVTGTDFKNGKINWETCVYVDDERYSQDTNIQLKKHDILITKDGTIGKIAYVDDVPIPSTLNTGVFVVRPINEKYVPLFLYYILQSDYFIKFITRIKAGSTISHLYQKDFKFFLFPIPPISEQEKIALILSNLDLLIQQEKQYKEKLENLKRVLMQQLLTGEKRVIV